MCILSNYYYICYYSSRRLSQHCSISFIRFGWVEYDFFQVRGTITSSSSSCSPSCWWEAGFSTVVSCVSDPTYSPITISDLFTVDTHACTVYMYMFLCFQTGPLTVCCIMRSRDCGAWSLCWSAALPGCSVSSCWPFITPAGPAWSCCCSSTRWLAVWSVLISI